MIVNAGDTVVLDCRALSTLSFPFSHLEIFYWSRDFVGLSSEPVYTIDRVDVSSEGVYQCSTLTDKPGENRIHSVRWSRHLVVKG